MGEPVRPRQRQSEILRRVRKQSRVDVDDLSAEFGVSAETIRRDLDVLATQGSVRRVHGGATQIKLATEGSLSDRMLEDSEAKGEIAQKLSDYLSKGDTIFVDTGSTTHACAELLAMGPSMTVITNSLNVARILGAPRSAHRVFLLGGRYGADNIQTFGPMVIEHISRFQADYAVLTVAAVDAEAGAMDADEAEADVARAMRSAAKKTVILAHGAKMGRRAAFKVCAPGEIDTLISDVPPPGDIAAALTSQGATLL